MTALLALVVLALGLVVERLHHRIKALEVDVREIAAELDGRRG